MYSITKANPSRRALLSLLAAAILAGTVTGARAMAGAGDGNELDPTDTIQRHYSVEQFIRLDRNDVYMVRLAVRRGHRVIIEGFSARDSRRIILKATEDWPAMRRKLRNRQDV